MHGKILRFLMMVLGAVALSIGASMFVLGGEVTGNFFASAFGVVTGSEKELTGLSDPNTDSELRFYAVFWMAYGGALIKCAQNLVQYSKHVPLLLGLFFLGGVGRLLSAFFVGQPHELFAQLMVGELVLPIVMFWLWFTYNRRMTRVIKY